MEVCEYAIDVCDKDGRICYHCCLNHYYIGLDIKEFCFECRDYFVCAEEAGGLKNASNV